MGQEVKIQVNSGTEKLNIFNQPPYEPQGVKYRVDTIDAISELVTFRGNPAKTIIFYDKEGVGIVLDDSIMDRTKDYGRFTFRQSDKIMEWRGLFERAIDQRKFVEFLKIRDEGEVEDWERLLAQIKQLSFATQIIGDYNYDDNNNVSVIFKKSDGEGTAKIPQQFIIHVPLIYGGPKVQSLEIQLELERPTSENQKPSFKLSCPKWNRYYQEAIEDEVDRLKGLLPGYQIIAGSL